MDKLNKEGRYVGTLDDGSTLTVIKKSDNLYEVNIYDRKGLDEWYDYTSVEVINKHYENVLKP